MEELTKQEQDFVKEVAITGNATQAVKKVYKKNRKTDGSARTKGSELMTNPNIIKAVVETKKSLAESIPNELVTAKHIALLNKTEKKYNTEGDLISEEIDTNAVKAGVEMAYKLKGSYEADERKSINILMPILVRFLNEKDNGNSDGNTSGVPQTV